VSTYSLLAVNADAKTVKGQARGYLTGILYLAPADLGHDGKNFCPFATPGCKRSCLNTAGRGIFDTVQAGRLRKRRLFMRHRAEFLDQLTRDIARLVRHAERLGLEPCVRLNGTSDLAWEILAPELFKLFPGVQFYDYTKIPARMRRAATSDWPSNYRLTFSRSERNDLHAEETMGQGGTAAVVFDTKRGRPLPASWHGFPVIDGDLSDLRFLDPPGVVVGLRAKGRAKRDKTGFVVRVA